MTKNIVFKKYLNLLISHQTQPETYSKYRFVIELFHNIIQTVRKFSFHCQRWVNNALVLNRNCSSRKLNFTKSDAKVFKL